MCFQKLILLLVIGSPRLFCKIYALINIINFHRLISSYLSWIISELSRTLWNTIKVLWIIVIFVTHWLKIVIPRTWELSRITLIEMLLLKMIISRIWELSRIILTWIVLWEIIVFWSCEWSRIILWITVVLWIVVVLMWFVMLMSVLCRIAVESRVTISLCV